MDRHPCDGCGAVTRRVGSGREERGDRGAALAFVLLLMLAVISLGHGVLASALGELAASRARVRQLEASAAAQAAVARALGQAAGAWLDSIAPGREVVADSLVVGPGHGLGALRRLDPEAWLVVGTGRSGGRATVRTARLAWSLDPVTRVTSLRGALSVTPGAPVTIAGAVEASDPIGAAPPLTAEECAPWTTDLAVHYATAPLVPVDAPEWATGPSLGLLTLARLLTRADGTISGTGTPQPTERLGACVSDDPWGWGDPEGYGPCRSHLPMRASEGDLSVVGGVGQGILVVGGELTLTAGARFYGLLIVGGPLRIEAGASLTGFALAGGGALVSAGSSVAASACWAVRSLAAHRVSLSRLQLVPGVPEVGPL